MRGTNWTLLSFTEDGVVTPALPGVSVTLIFDGDGAHGSGGCNSYGGEYSVSVDGSIRFRNIASTEMFCTAPEGVSEQEARYFTLLLEVSSFEIESGRLRLFSADRARSLTFSAGTP